MHSQGSIFAGAKSAPTRASLAKTSSSDVVAPVVPHRAHIYPTSGYSTLRVAPLQLHYYPFLQTLSVFIPTGGYALHLPLHLEACRRLVQYPRAKAPSILSNSTLSRIRSSPMTTTVFISDDPNADRYTHEKLPTGSMDPVRLVTLPKIGVISTNGTGNLIL